VTLYIQSLTLSHFRSHLAAKLTFDGRPVTIYGPNGAGKTNILEAVSMLSPGRGIRRASTDQMIRVPQSIGWNITAELHSLEQVHEIVTQAEPGASRDVLIDGKSAPQLALGRIGRMLWLVPSMDRLWIEGADGRRQFLDRMAMSFEPTHAQHVLTYEKAMRERNRLLKDMVTDAIWYLALEAQMATAGAAITANRLMTLERVAQSTNRSAFPAAQLSLMGPVGEDNPQSEADLTKAFADGRRRDLTAGRTLAGPHRADFSAIYAAKGIAAEQCSTGEQKALLISLILANARALTQDFGAPPILLLDEVAAHLDSERRAALYREILAVKAQAFMTGTGPELLVTDQGGTSAIEQV
jgi:DNA replication and repair protein RecF